MATCHVYDFFRNLDETCKDRRIGLNWIGFDELLIDLQIKFSGPNTVLLGSCIKR